VPRESLRHQRHTEVLAIDLYPTDEPSVPVYITHMHSDALIKNVRGRKGTRMCPKRLVGFWCIDPVESDAHRFIVTPDRDRVAIGHTDNRARESVADLARHHCRTQKCDEQEMEW